MVNLFPLTVTGAIARRRGKVLVGPVDFKFDGGDTLVVIGPNGSGKTTFLSMLHGTTRLSDGDISWGCPLPDARAAQSFVFQRPILLRRSVRDNIAYPLRIRGIARSKAGKIAEDWAHRVGLGDMLDRRALALSGGEQQKLALARALVLRPALVFLDEPCAALDGRSTRAIERILQDAKDGGTRLILSTHDMGQARRLAGRIFFMLHGKLHESGPADAFFSAPRTREAQAFLQGDIVE